MFLQSSSKIMNFRVCLARESFASLRIRTTKGYVGFCISFNSD